MLIFHLGNKTKFNSRHIQYNILPRSKPGRICNTLSRKPTHRTWNPNIHRIGSSHRILRSGESTVNVNVQMNIANISSKLLNKQVNIEELMNKLSYTCLKTAKKHTIISATDKLIKYANILISINKSKSKLLLLTLINSFSGRKEIQGNINKLKTWIYITEDFLSYNNGQGLQGIILQESILTNYGSQFSSLLYSALSQQYNVEEARDRHIVRDSHIRRLNPATWKEHRRATHDCPPSAFLYMFSLTTFKCKNIICKVQYVKAFSYKSCNLYPLNSCKIFFANNVNKVTHAIKIKTVKSFFTNILIIPTYTLNIKK